jgi:hypothetical protein
VYNDLFINDIHRRSGDKNQEERLFFHTEKDFSTVLIQLSTGWLRKESVWGKQWMEGKMKPRMPGVASTWGDGARKSGRYGIPLEKELDPTC